jgi:hypothetical protein
MLAALFLLSASRHVTAQSAALSPPPARTEVIAQVTVDLSAAAFDRTLPFDAPFFIAGRAPDGTVDLTVQYAAIPDTGDTSQLAWLPIAPARWRPEGPTRGSQPFLVLVRMPLEADRHYRVRFVFETEGVTGATTAYADGRTAGKSYVSADAGLLYAGDLGIGALYLGSNIYFRPINKDAPLREFGGLSRRVALTVGVTVSSIADENEKTRSDLFWNQSLVLGAGYRITSSVRGGGGVLIFREANPNPLVTRKSAAVTWFVSFSFDLNVLKGFAG